MHYRELNQLVVATLVELTASKNDKRRCISKELAGTLVSEFVRAVIGKMKDACD